MSRVIVGCYPLSSYPVQIVIETSEYGGSFYSYDEKEKKTIVVIGVASWNWFRVLSILLHEATEFVYTHLGLRYAPAPDYANDNAAYLFSFTHTQFGEATARVGEFLALCFADFSTAYKKLDDKRRQNVKPAHASKRKADRPASRTRSHRRKRIEGTPSSKLSGLPAEPKGVPTVTGSEETAVRDP